MPRQKGASGSGKNSMSDKYFVDTNLLVYSLDEYDLEKQHQARALLRAANRNRQLVLSTQVFQEFYVAATRKLGVDPLVAKQLLLGFSHCEIMTVTLDLIKEAIDCSVTYTLSFWDALIIVAADYAHCSELWSEDLNDGQLIRGITVRNPFLNYDALMARF